MGRNMSEESWPCAHKKKSCTPDWYKRLEYRSKITRLKEVYISGRKKLVDGKRHFIMPAGDFLKTGVTIPGEESKQTRGKGQ